jgi:hypothetical protein
MIWKATLEQQDGKYVEPLILTLTVQADTILEACMKAAQRVEAEFSTQSWFILAIEGYKS